MSNPVAIPGSGSGSSNPQAQHNLGGSAPIHIPQSNPGRASSVGPGPGRSYSTRRSSNSQGASGLGRRPSRVTHPPPVPPRALSHDEALEALRGFLKERSSYDVFPVSFRLIVLDTTLRVRKALEVMLLYSELFWMRLHSAEELTRAGVVSAPLWDTETAKFAGETFGSQA